MPVYYFDVRSPDDFIEDLEGTDLPDLDAVRIEARESARAIIADAVAFGRLNQGQSFEIRNEAGEIVLTYPFKNALTVA